MKTNFEQKLAKFLEKSGLPEIRQERIMETYRTQVRSQRYREAQVREAEERKKLREEEAREAKGTQFLIRGKEVTQQERNVFIVKNYNNGKSLKNIAKDVGLSYQYTCQLAAQLIRAIHYNHNRDFRVLCGLPADADEMRKGKPSV